MFTLIEENYLKALFHLSAQSGEVSVNELSKCMKVKMPTVNSMIKNLAEKKLVQYKVYKPLKLTTKGKAEAGKIIRKHRLTEMFLVKNMGFSWDEVHEIAEQVEHIQSEAFFDKMNELMGYPTSDPHGSPIPDKNGNVLLKNYVKLSSIAPGLSVRFKSVYNASDDFLRYLSSKHIQLNCSIQIETIEAFDASLQIRIDNRFAEQISAQAANQILVAL